MHVTFFDDTKVTATAVQKTAKKLDPWLLNVNVLSDTETPYAALTTWRDETMLEQVHTLVNTFTKPKHLVLVGIGGSSLGTEAIHAVLATANSPQLHVLDTIAPHELDAVLTTLQKIKKVRDIVVCIVSKSGTTVETLANAETLLTALEAQFGTDIWQQTIAMSEEKSPLTAIAKKRKAHTITLPPYIGGRYSVFTPVGLVPLALLGHDIEALLAGAEDAATEPFQHIALENAARLYLHMKAGFRHYNFFAFDTRLVRLGKWYRQLMAESLGKATTKEGTPVTIGAVPTISTAVDLHSIGQLYFAQFPGVYTDFVSFSDEAIDYKIAARPKLATNLATQSHQDLAAAIYAGVVRAYQTQSLPYCSVVLDEGLDYSLGLFMATRMLEVMAVAELLHVDAFDQPNVELYKKHTRNILQI